MSVPELYKIPHEVPGFQIPPHGSPMQVQYITSLKMGNGENMFLKGVNNLPIKDIEKVFNVTSEGEEPTQEKVTHLAQMLTFNLLANRICEQCGDKRDLTKLSICGSCALAWYCSKECQERHWSTHKLRCCKKDGPLNTGYQAIAMVKMK